MLLPIFLILSATVAACCFAFGTEPVWGNYHHGLSIIIWSRRLEWPLIVAAALLCVGLILLVITGKRKFWWLLGLLPVTLLIVHRVKHPPSDGLRVVQVPAFTTPTDATAIPATDLIVGIVTDGRAMAYPCRGLFSSPVVLRGGLTRPAVLLWSRAANHALAFMIDRELRAADLEIVCAPNDAAIIYNSRLGEFINCMTGRTLDGSVPTGFREAVPVVKTTWQRWQAMHPDSLLASLKPNAGDFSQPMQSRGTLGRDSDSPIQRMVCTIACTQPIAVPSEAVTERPLNLNAGPTPILLVRVSGIVRAFSRELPGDLIPRFSPLPDPKHKEVAWVDSDTNSKWSEIGVLMEGPKEMKGAALKPIASEDQVDWNVMKVWFPELRLVTAAEITAGKLVEKPPVEKPQPRRRRSPRPQ